MVQQVYVNSLLEELPMIYLMINFEISDWTDVGIGYVQSVKDSNSESDLFY